MDFIRWLLNPIREMIDWMIRTVNMAMEGTLLTTERFPSPEKSEMTEKSNRNRPYILSHILQRTP